jgi:hypothetical protein
MHTNTRISTGEKCRLVALREIWEAKARSRMPLAAKC